MLPFMAYMDPMGVWHMYLTYIASKSIHVLLSMNPEHSPGPWYKVALAPRRVAYA